MPPLSYIDYEVGSAGEQAGTFSNIDLDYVATTDIYMTVSLASTGEDKPLTNTTHFTVTTSPWLSVQITADGFTELGVANLVNGDKVRVGRETPVSSLVRDFSDGSVLKASDLNAQNTQFLYHAQEVDDGVDDGLPITVDGAFDAGNRKIKNIADPTADSQAVNRQYLETYLPKDSSGNYNVSNKKVISVGSPTSEQDAATKQYVDGLSLYPGTPAVPQAWQITSDGTAGPFALDSTSGSGDPTSTDVDMYIVDVDGVLQVATTDFTISSSGITMVGGSLPGSGDIITVRNFGVARSILEQPVTPDTSSDAGLTVKGLTSQTGDLIKVQDNAGDDLLTVSKDGHLNIGTWDNSSTDTSGLFVRDTNEAYAQMSMQAKASQADSSNAFSVYHGDTVKSVMDYAGNLDLQGILKIAGINTIPILQIVELTTPGGSDGNLEPVGSSIYGQKVVTGNQFVITPKRSDSKLLFLARYGWRSYSSMDVSHPEENHNIFYHGGDVHHHINNTASPGSQSNGTTIGIKARSYDAYWRNNQQTIYGEMTSIFTHDSPGTSEFVLDVCAMSRVNAENSEGTTVPHTFSIYTSDYSTGICVEYYIPS